MNERLARLWAGTEAESIGYGGLALVARATGLAISTVQKARNELRSGTQKMGLVKVRREGGGRRAIEVAHPQLVSSLRALVDPNTRGDPMSPLRRMYKSMAAWWRRMGKARHPDAREFFSTARAGGSNAARSRV